MRFLIETLIPDPKDPPPKTLLRWELTKIRTPRTDPPNSRIPFFGPQQGTPNFGNLHQGKKQEHDEVREVG